jgi:hypothetical protein
MLIYNRQTEFSHIYNNQQEERPLMKWLLIVFQAFNAYFTLSFVNAIPEVVILNITPKRFRKTPSRIHQLPTTRISNDIIEAIGQPFGDKLYFEIEMKKI